MRIVESPQPTDEEFNQYMEETLQSMDYETDDDKILSPLNPVQLNDQFDLEFLTTETPIYDSTPGVNRIPTVTIDGVEWVREHEIELAGGEVEKSPALMEWLLHNAIPGYREYNLQEPNGPLGNSIMVDTKIFRYQWIGQNMGVSYETFIGTVIGRTLIPLREYN